MIAAIDPGATTAIAVCNASSVLYTWSGQLVDALTKIEKVQDEFGITMWVLEVPHRPTFHHATDDRRKREKISRNVGSVQRDAQLLAQWLTRKGMTWLHYKPRGAKWGPAIVEQVTGYERRTNQHVRDAIRMAWTYRGIQA